MTGYRPRREEMVLAILLSTVVLGFIGLMGYMMYLTPGPTDRLE
jgi:preprotein translocase subunit Sss1